MIKAKPRDIFEAEYCMYRCCVDDDSKYEWAASEVFNLTTYDGSLDELFAKKIIEVCKVILERRNFDYIKDKTNYVPYILVCQLLDNFHWIDWGTSIRGAWFDADHPNCEVRPLLKYYSRSTTGFQEIPFTEENLKTLIKFIEEDTENV
jgi:hypothetical protein